MQEGNIFQHSQDAGGGDQTDKHLVYTYCHLSFYNKIPKTVYPELNYCPTDKPKPPIPNCNIITKNEEQGVILVIL